MMGVYVPNIKMPDDCRECPFEVYYVHCGITMCRCMDKVLAEDYKTIQFFGRPDWCPLEKVDDKEIMK